VQIIEVRRPGTPNDKADPPPSSSDGRRDQPPGFAGQPYGDPALRGMKPTAETMRDPREFYVYGFKDVVLLSRAGGQACTATFIHKEWVVTAAHCIATWTQRGGTRLIDDWQGLRVYRVLEGSDSYWWDTQGNVQPANLRNTPTMRPTVVHVHEQWTAGTTYDVAVVKLQTSAEREPRMATIATQETTSTEMTLAGYGDTTGTTRHAKALEVGWQYGQFAEGLVHLTVLGGATNCLGDSGGPVFAGRQVGYSGERHVLVGIISSRAVASGSEPCIGTLGYAVRLDRQDTRSWLCKATDGAVDACRMQGSQPATRSRVSASP
jgi:V8-like Glu-specific endopeptidase